MSVTDAAGSVSRLERLLSYLEQDPANLSLIAEAAGAALDEGALEQAGALLEAYGQIAPMPPSLVNLEGLLALRSRRFEDATRIFSSLLDGAPDDPALRQNLTWAQFMGRDFEGALASLGDVLPAEAPEAAALKVQALHHLGRIDEAMICGKVLAEIHPQHQGLMSALAVLAIDAEQPDLAGDYATRAGDTHEGLSTLGVLTLGDNQIEAAGALFDSALKVYPRSARALVGQGLVRMARGEPGEAAVLLAQGAQIFGDHLGSWVAVGWAQFAAGDYAASRATFEQALALDDTFAESHGALAVLDVVEGDIDSAKARAKVASRLDRQCFSAALANSLIFAAKGDEASAERVRQAALNTPVGPSGQTLAQAMVALGAGFGPAR